MPGQLERIAFKFVVEQAPVSPAGFAEIARISEDDARAALDNLAAEGKIVRYSEESYGIPGQGRKVTPPIPAPPFKTTRTTPARGEHPKKVTVEDVSKPDSDSQASE